MGINKAILVGNLGRDPELRMTSSQTAVCNLNLATAERRRDASGTWNDHTEWHRIVAFGKTAENCAQYLKKGRQVYVEGRLQTRKWTDKSGVEKYSTEIVADTIQFLGSGRGGEGGRGVESESSAPTIPDNLGLKSADDISSPVGNGAGIEEDDIPF